MRHGFVIVVVVVFFFYSNFRPEDGDQDAPLYNTRRSHSIKIDIRKSFDKSIKID